jgi:polyketide synthase 7
MTNDEKLRDYLKRVTVDLHDARRRLREIERQGSESLAIVGMSCRYPGWMTSPEELWEAVSTGRDAISGFPTDRGWESQWLPGSHADRVGGDHVREGGFLYDAADFDADFFSISPREALTMDPQQRLLLEASWEALENAGIETTSLRGSQTGVFIGASSSGYGAAALFSAPENLDGSLSTGILSSIMSGRISYTFGFEGPALTIDTACSSSLVALHLACGSLRTRECSLALVGGVSVMPSPLTLLEFVRLGGIAHDGRCKSFADAADGTSWSEGVGMVALERLSDAWRLGHRVLAVVRGSAVNQDGASNGLTAPNGPSQQRVIRRALANAELAGHQVDAVEGHGTGTTLGDPIEAQTLLATYGQDRPEGDPLWLGSIKSNIGHAQAAAGVAGVIKMVMALRHASLPQTLHVDRPSEKVNWSAGAVSLLTDARPWPPCDRPRRAAVSSFGMSGTNAHVIIEEAPALAERPRGGGGDGAPAVEAPALAEQPRAGDGDAAPSRAMVLEPDAWPLVLSARSERALREQAARLSAFMGGERDIADIGISLIRRSTFQWRGVVVGRDRLELSRGLDALAGEASVAGVVSGNVGHSGTHGVVFVFPGQGSQWTGMALELLERSPLFAEHLRRCGDALAPHTGWSLEDMLSGVGGTRELERVDVVQPCLFAIMVALARLWSSCGVRPDVVLGHSQGEIAAACVAGALSLEDAARVVALRGRALVALAGLGGMVAITSRLADVEARLRRFEGRLSVAAVNGPGSVVVSGELSALEQLLESCEADGVKARSIPVDYAAHSPQVEQIRDELLEGCAGIVPRSASVRFCSSVTGGPLDGAELDADYWYRNLRDTVRFEHASRALMDAGQRTFIELSPHPVLTVALHETADAAGTQASAPVSIAALGSLRRGEGGPRRFLTSLGAAWAHGVNVDWEAVFRGSGAEAIQLPNYPFQRRRYWLENSLTPQDSADGSGRSIVNGWRYQVQWKPVAGASASALSGTWLVIVPRASSEDSWVAMLLDTLERRGADVAVVHIDGASESREQLVQRLRVTVDAGVRVDGVISLLALDERRDRACVSVPQGVIGTVVLAQALGDMDLRAPLWLLTRGAMSVAPSDRVSTPVQAQVWGLGLVVGLEHPERWGGLVDLPETFGERVGSLLVGVLADRRGEDQLAIRGTGVLARRAARSHAREGIAGEAWTPPAGTVLITGGTGALGAHVARWLAAGGADHLLLVSRRGANAPGAAELRAELAGLGAQVTIAACDVADREQLSGLLESLPEDRPLSVVVHAAGAPVVGPLDSLTVGDLELALSAKAQGALNLHALTEDLDLSAFVLFSSIAGTFGAGWHASYAAANACLDALAAQRRERGLPATSIAWGPWAGEGMMAARDDAGEAMRRRGLRLLEPGLAIEALQSTLSRGDTSVVLADVEWETYAPLFTFARPRPMIEDLPEVRAALRATGSGEQDAARDLQGRLRVAPADERQRILLELVRVEAARILGHASPDAIDPDRPFIELGFNSLMAVELRNRLNGMTDLRIPTSAMFDRPTPGALAAYVDLLLADPSRDARSGPDAMDLGALQGSSSQDDPPGTLVSMLQEAHHGGVVDEFMDMLMAASRFRPVFRAAAAREVELEWATLADGPAPNHLICLPSALAPSGLHQYVRFARTFRGDRAVSALALPGFARRERLPESLEAVVEALAVTVRRRSGEGSFVLAGYSSGGWLANALASRLECEEGSTVAAVVLLDSLPAVWGASVGALRAVLSDAVTDDVLAFVNDDRLTAIGAYMRLLADWRPVDVATPTLFVRAGESLPAVAVEIADERWEPACSEIEVPGNHFTMMHQHVDTTAQAVQAWLSTTLDRQTV